jgi:hypothetical protein
MGPNVRHTNDPATTEVCTHLSPRHSVEEFSRFTIERSQGAVLLRMRDQINLSTVLFDRCRNPATQKWRIYSRGWGCIGYLESDVGKYINTRSSYHSSVKKEFTCGYGVALITLNGAQSLNHPVLGERRHEYTTPTHRIPFLSRMVAIGHDDSVRYHTMPSISPKPTRNTIDSAKIRNPKTILKYLSSADTLKHCTVPTCVQL